MNIIFFDDNRNQFLPLAYTKPIAKFRVGIITIEEKWEKHFKKNNVSITTSYLTEEYLSGKFALKEEKENIFINARFFPNASLVAFITNSLASGEAVESEGSLVVAKCSLQQFKSKSYKTISCPESNIDIELTSITDIFSKNDIAITSDYKLLTEGRKSAEISSTNTIIGTDIFIEEGVKVEASVFNTNNGPIYIGKDAEVMEGSLVRGPFAMNEGAVLKMGAKIYGATTIGKHSKVGGEVNNCVIQDFSNKGHDGFLGNSIIGEWCNLGADTNTSNLKNNYGEVKLWSYKTGEMESAGLQFCGLIMGDHTKCGINTMFNTGTVIGVSANVFGSGFPSKFIPSYSWGGVNGFDEYKLDKMFDVAEKVMERRGVELTNEDKTILTAIFDETAKYR
ncbi:MAG: glucose-1-phosphate thymidylyltransferase [Flavobacteriales bacterium]|nr:MAG: glucose-1-phosphate thymidylyltransferase [Flavobacteriales bacterium]